MVDMFTDSKSRRESPQSGKLQRISACKNRHVEYLIQISVWLQIINSFDVSESSVDEAPKLEKTDL